MATMTGAEMRATLYLLGLTLDSFSIYTGRDQRTLRRMGAGTTPVTSPVQEMLEALARQAELELQRWDTATEAGTPIYIPALNTPQEPGTLPPHWYLALAGRHIAEWGLDAQIEWE